MIGVIKPPRRLPEQLLSRSELRTVASSLRRLLDQIEGGEIEASAMSTARLEGALLVVSALADGRMPTASDLVGEQISGPP